MHDTSAGRRHATASFEFSHPPAGTPRLTGDGCRHAESGSIRVTALGRPYRWKDSRTDPTAELAALAGRIERSGLEAALDCSAVLRRMLARHPVEAFRGSRAAGRDAEFWVRCVQVARLEQLARKT